VAGREHGPPSGSKQSSLCPLPERNPERSWSVYTTSPHGSQRRSADGLATVLPRRLSPDASKPFDDCRSASRGIPDSVSRFRFRGAGVGSLTQPGGPKSSPSASGPLSKHRSVPLALGHSIPRSAEAPRQHSPSYAAPGTNPVNRQGTAGPDQSLSLPVPNRTPSWGWLSPAGERGGCAVLLQQVLCFSAGFRWAAVLRRSPFHQSGR